MRGFQTSSLPGVSGWIGRVLRFDFSAFDEIRSHPAATTPALLVVVVASVLAGFGSWIWALQTDSIDGGEVFVKSLVIGSILQALAWLVWVYVTRLVLARYGAHSDLKEMVRVMGFAFAPVGLTILIAITPLAVPIGIALWALAVLVNNAAIQSATTADSQQVTVANITGFAAFALIMGFLANISEIGNVGGLAPGLFFFALDL